MKEEIEVALDGELLDVQTYTTWHLLRILFRLFGFLILMELALQVIWLIFGEAR